MVERWMLIYPTCSWWEKVHGVVAFIAFADGHIAVGKEGEEYETLANAFARLGHKERSQIARGVFDRTFLEIRTWDNGVDTPQEVRDKVLSALTSALRIGND